MIAYWMNSAVWCVCRVCKKPYYAGHICPGPFKPRLRGGEAAQAAAVAAR